MPRPNDPAADLEAILEELVEQHGRFGVTPRQVLAEPESFPYQTSRISESGLGIHAIHVIRRRDRTLIMDGIHRLTAAVTNGNSTIRSKMLQPNDVRRIVVDA